MFSSFVIVLGDVFWLPDDLCSVILRFLCGANNESAGQVQARSSLTLCSDSVRVVRSPAAVAGADLDRPGSPGPPVVWSACPSIG